MHKTSPIDAITQQLNDLSLDQLLEVRAKVDTFIQEKSSQSHEGQQQSTLISSFLGSSTGSYCHTTLISSQKTDVDCLITISSPSMKGEGLKSFENGFSLEKVIDLVDEWMADESGYDEETFPQIETALNQNHLSL